MRFRRLARRSVATRCLLAARDEIEIAAINDERFVPANGLNPRWSTYYYTVHLHDNSMPPSAAATRDRARCHRGVCPHRPTVNMRGGDARGRVVWV
ncbi:MAG: hypothetical protein ACRDSF_02465 [Pseudonocardiaceae bacterium]